MSAVPWEVKPPCEFVTTCDAVFATPLVWDVLAKDEPLVPHVVLSALPLVWAFMVPVARLVVRLPPWDVLKDVVSVVPVVWAWVSVVVVPDAVVCAVPVVSALPPCTPAVMLLLRLPLTMPILPPILPPRVSLALQPQLDV